MYQVLQQQVLLLLLLLLLRALQQHEDVVVHSRDGSHPTESLAEQNCVSSGYGRGYVCLMNRRRMSHGIQTGKPAKKQDKR